jgi:putative endonuclease
MPKQPAVYTISNQHRNVLYIGVTSDLIKRIYQHKSGQIEGFSKDYNCHDLLYYELHETMEAAILREKQLKGWSRIKKERLITTQNPERIDLYPSIL